METRAEWAEEVTRLARQRDAVILAHNDQLPQPADTEVLFCPDQFLGAHVQRLTGRDSAQVQTDPEAELFIQPECGCATSALYLAGAGVVPAERTRILSTSQMVAAARDTTAMRTMTDEVTPPSFVADRARRSMERMIAIGSPSRTGE